MCGSYSKGSGGGTYLLLTAGGASSFSHGSVCVGGQGMCIQKFFDMFSAFTPFCDSPHGMSTDVAGS